MTVPPFPIRRLQAQDLTRVAAFERDIALISFPDDPVTDLRFYERKLAAAIEDARADPLVVTRGEDLIGWAWLVGRENFTTRELYGDLRSFYVVEAVRGTGCAFALMRACLDAAKGRGYARLVGRTAAENEAMQAIYALYGFAPRHVVYECVLEGAQPPVRSRPGLDLPRRPAGRSGRSRRSGNPPA